jgi:hypothetical protein
MQTLKFVKFNCEHALGQVSKIKLKVYLLMCIERNDKGGKLIILLCFFLNAFDFLCLFMFLRRATHF